MGALRERSYRRLQALDAEWRIYDQKGLVVA